MSVAELSMEELEALVERLILRAKYRDMPKQESESGRSMEEIHASIQRNRWTPPPGAPSPVEMLQEDRRR